eukprot:815011_1
MYVVLLQLVMGNNPSLGDMSKTFFTLAIGGPAIGIAAGLLMTFWLSYSFNDVDIEVNITLVFAYLCFYFAEFVNSSGFLAIVFMGLVGAKYAAVVSPVVVASMD